ncbi:hypothetical protein ABPG77_011305 [Micractinium sp. CCAP 211/92]
MLLAYVLLAMTVCSPLARAQLTPASNPVPTNLESGLLTDLANRNNTGNQGPVGSGNSTSSASDGYFDATTVIPPSQLGWLLTPPPGGWQEWSAPASDSGGVSAAAGGGVARPEADPAGLSRVHALLVASHLDDAALSAARLVMAAPPPGSVSAAVAPADIPLSMPSLVPTGSARRRLSSVTQSHRTILGDGSLGGAEAAGAAATRVAAAAAKRRSKTMAGLPGLAAWKRSFAPNVRMPRPHSVAYPPWGLLRSQPRKSLGCPAGGNVKRRGVGLKGNGVANEAPALAKADRARGTRLHYFPPGTYRIRSSLTLSKPVVMGARTRFSIDRGATLTLLSPPRRAPIWGDPMFTGQGFARMGRAVREVLPAWWSHPSLGDAQIMQAALRSCTAACTVLLSRPLFPRGAINMVPNAGVFSTAKALIYGQNNQRGEGLVLQPGAYKAPLVFTGIRSFKQFGLKVLPGVRNANIQVAALSLNNDGIVFQGGAAPISNVYVSQINVAQMNQNTVVFSSGKQAGRFSGITVRANFIVSGGQMNGMERRPSSCLVVRGRPPLLSQTQMVVQAIDPAQFIKPTLFVPVRSTAAGPVTNLAFRSESWNGGYRAPGGAQVDGAFVRSSFLFKWSDSVGRAFVLRARSVGNALRNGDVGEVTAASHFYELNGVPGSLGQFLSANRVTGAVNSPGFYVTFRTQRDWPPGKQRTLYFHTQFAQPGAVARRVDCVPFRETNPGVLCVRLAPAPTGRNPNRVAVSLMNLSRRVIKAGYQHRVGVQLVA